MQLKEAYTRLIYNGVDESTPGDLVDRIVYSNFVCLSIGVVVLLAAWAATARHHTLLLCIDSLYILGTVACMLLNRMHHYLTARTVLLSVIFSGITFTCGVQGNAGQVEHFFLAAGVLAYSMFHPSERRSAIVFAILSVGLYAFFVNRAQPLWDIDPHRAQYGVQGAWVNQILYLVLYSASLIGLSNAYRRAIKIVDVQRDRIFEQNRLSTVGAMAANMAHEINSPLSALDMQVHTLLENLEGESAGKAENIKIVQKIASISSRISTLVRGYKFLSRSTGNEPYSKIAASQLVDSVVDLSSGRLRKSNIKLELNIPNPGMQIECRPVAVSQVLLNLLNNAIDAVEKLEESQRQISVSLHTDQQTAYISVVDPGHISSQSIRDKLFDPFFTTKPIGKGTGLGLSIARQSIEQNGGKLYLDRSHPTTRFVIELPVTAPRREPAVKISADLDLRILIVDDDADFVEILGIVLRRQGYTVIEASSGNRALQILKSDPKIQFIISDCYMDDGSGKELLIEVRKINPQFPLFFMVTGQSDFGAAEAIELGAQEFILKPINIPQLLQLIRAYAPKA